MVYYSALHWAKKAEKSAEKCEQIQEDLDASGLDLSKYARKSDVESSISAVDSNAVHNTGNETIDGIKSFNNDVYIKNRRSLIVNSPNLDNKDLSAWRGDLTLYHTDKNNERVLGIYATQTTSGNVCQFMAYDPTNEGTYRSSNLSIIYNKDGNTYATAPTPPATASTSTSTIATTGWVNDPTKSTNVVHRSGDESFSGTKTMTSKSFRFGNTNLGDYKEIEALSEKGSTRLGVLRFQNGSDGVTRSIDISVVDNTNSYRGGLKVGINSGGAPYAVAPTPPTGDNSTKIATTEWVNSKHKVVSALPSSPTAGVFYYITE